MASRLLASSRPPDDPTAVAVGRGREIDRDGVTEEPLEYTVYYEVEMDRHLKGLDGANAMSGRNDPPDQQGTRGGNNVGSVAERNGIHPHRMTHSNKKFSGRRAELFDQNELGTSVDEKPVSDGRLENFDLMRIPSTSEWWGLLCLRYSSVAIKSQYMIELSTVMFVDALIAGFTFSAILTPLSADMDEQIATAFTAFLYLSFLSAMTSLFFMVTSYAQLNIRNDPESIVKFFIDPATSTLPLWSALLTLGTVTFVIVACVIFACDSSNPQSITLLAIVYASVMYIWAFRQYLKLNNVLLKEIDSLRNHAKKAQASEMYKWFKDNDILLSYGEIVGKEIYTLEELTQVVEAMTLAEFVSCFAINPGPALIIYQLRGSGGHSAAAHSSTTAVM